MPLAAPHTQKKTHARARANTTTTTTKQTPAVWRPEALLAEPLVHDAVVEMLRVLRLEQRHDERSPYR